uniref:Uncharacterized protein n=1 Tax=Arundo donax TaxID=35708 RepID=A0A0A9A6H1_ARUDO
MSWNSLFWMVSSSTAKIWLLALPLLWRLKSPSNPLIPAAERFLLGLTRKAMPWELRLG